MLSGEYKFNTLFLIRIRTLKTTTLIVVATLALTFQSAEAQPGPASAQAPTTAQCGPTQTTHVVVAGDTCESISRKYYEGRPYLVQLLREVNKLNQACTIKVGQSLVVPTCLNNLGPAPPQAPRVRVVTPRPTAPAPAPVVTAQSPSAPPAPITINNNNNNVVILYTPPAPEEKTEPAGEDDQ